MSSAARTGLLLASDLAITISNFGKRIIPADESLEGEIVARQLNKITRNPIISYQKPCLKK